MSEKYKTRITFDAESDLNVTFIASYNLIGNDYERTRTENVSFLFRKFLSTFVLIDNVLENSRLKTLKLKTHKKANKCCKSGVGYIKVYENL